MLVQKTKTVLDEAGKQVKMLVLFFIECLFVSSCEIEGRVQEEKYKIFQINAPKTYKNYVSQNNCHDF